MANWNDIKLRMSHAADKTIKKAGELADSASLKFKLKTLNVKLGDKYEKLGRLTYKQLKTERSQAEAISAVITDIDSLREEIKQLKERIEEDKHARRESPEDIDVDDEEASDASENDAESN